MKLQLIAFLVFFIFNFGFGQNGLSPYWCDCLKLGLDSIWADTNKINCYLIPVERNYEKPRNKNYLLAAAVAPALTSNAKEPILYLHGGPGIATLCNLPKYLNLKTFALLREDHPLVFFDYRGTGFSEPSFCPALNDTIKRISNGNPSIIDEIQRSVLAYSNCKQELEEQDVLLSDFSSLQSAFDAETVRQLLSVEEWNIFAVSHGTTVALNMMRSFPDKIRSVILDSPFPPNAPWSDFIHPFDLSFSLLEKEIAADSIDSKFFQSVRTDFVNISNKLRHKPFKIKLQSKENKNTKNYLFNANDFAWSIWTAMLDPYSVALVPLALKEIAADNDSVLLQWALTFNDPNSFGTYSEAQSKAILCYESKPKSMEETENYLLQHFPDFKGFIKPGLEQALFETYRPESPPLAYFDPVQSTIPTLIYSGQYDPVCPPLFGKLTAKSLINSTFILVTAASHAAIYTDSCTRNIGKQFFQNPQSIPETDCLTQRNKIEFVKTNLLKYLQF